jgi:hypothetical protein
MPKTVYSTYTSEDFDLDFVAQYGDFDNIPPDIEILSLHILGCSVILHTLPKDLQAAILSLHPQTL